MIALLSKNRRFYFALIALVVGGIVYTYNDVNLRLTTDVPLLMESKNQNLHLSDSVKDTPTESPSLKIKDYVSFQSQKIGLPTDRPDEIRNELTRFAESLHPQDIDELGKLFQNSKNGDEKALALYLLSESQNPHSVDILKDIILQPATSQDEHQALENQAFSFMAIEGISQSKDPILARQALQEVIQKTSDVSIRDRSTRALLSISNPSKTLETQDRENLLKLLDQQSSPSK